MSHETDNLRFQITSSETNLRYLAGEPDSEWKTQAIKTCQDAIKEEQAALDNLEARQVVYDLDTGKFFVAGQGFVGDCVNQATRMNRDAVGRLRNLHRDRHISWTDPIKSGFVCLCGHSDCQSATLEFPPVNA